MAAPAKKRRTQEERREATIRKLLEAAIATLVEVGYARASVQAICARAEISQGGLFRHFASREALMVAVGQHVGRQLLDGFRRAFEARREGEDPIALALALLRRQTRSTLNQAWYELALAARTSDGLRGPLAPVAAAYYASIEEVARGALPDLAEKLGDDFALLVDTVVSAFDGENLHRFVLEQPDLEDRRLTLLSTLIQSLAPRRSLT